jgi:hypothetical protein
MRKITQESITAFNNDFTFNKSNTIVKTGYGKHELLPKEKGRLTVMSLFGNDIAIKINGKLFITNAGWKSNTTKERLNAINGVSISQRDFKWFLNGVEWDGKLIAIK